MRQGQDRDIATLFLHIPKTAGVSLNQHIAEAFAARAIHPYNVYGHRGNMRQFQFDSNEAYAYYPGHYLLQHFRASTSRISTTITMLRDPVERFLSLFYFLQAHPIIYKDHPEIDVQKLSIEAYVANDRLVDMTDNTDPQAFHLIGNIDWEDRTPPDGLSTRIWPGDLDTCLERSRQTLDGIEVVGLTERFADSIQLLCYTYGWSPPREIVHENATKRPASLKIDQDLRKQIVAYSPLDIALYAYGTALFERRYRAMLRDLHARYGNGAAPVGEGSPREAVWVWLVRHAAAVRRGSA